MLSTRAGTSPNYEAIDVIETALRARRHTWDIRHAEEYPEHSSPVRVLISHGRQVCSTLDLVERTQQFRAMVARDGKLLCGPRGRFFAAGATGTVHVWYTGRFEGFTFVPDGGVKGYRISRGAFRRL